MLFFSIAENTIITSRLVLKPRFLNKHKHKKFQLKNKLKMGTFLWIG